MRFKFSTKLRRAFKIPFIIAERRRRQEFSIFGGVKKCSSFSSDTGLMVG